MYFSVRSVLGVSVGEKLTQHKYFAFLSIGSDACITVYAQGSDMYMHACIMNVYDCGGWQIRTLYITLQHPVLHFPAAAACCTARLVRNKEGRKKRAGNKRRGDKQH